MVVRGRSRGWSRGGRMVVENGSQVVDSTGGWSTVLTDAGRFAGWSRLVDHIERFGKSGRADPCGRARADT